MSVLIYIFMIIQVSIFLQKWVYCFITKHYHGLLFTDAKISKN